MRNRDWTRPATRYELLCNGKRERAFGIGHLVTGYRGRILRGCESCLSLLATFERVPNSDIVLSVVVQECRGQLAGLKDRDKLRIPRKQWIRPQVCRDLIRLALENLALGSFQGMTVFDGKLDGVIQRDSRREFGRQL